MPIYTVNVVFSTDDQAAADNAINDVALMVHNAVDSISVTSATVVHEDGQTTDLLAFTPVTDPASQGQTQEAGAEPQTQPKPNVPSQEGVPTGKEF